MSNKWQKQYNKWQYGNMAKDNIYILYGANILISSKYYSVKTKHILSKVSHDVLDVSEVLFHMTNSLEK